MPGIEPGLSVRQTDVINHYTTSANYDQHIDHIYIRLDSNQGTLEPKSRPVDHCGTHVKSQQLESNQL